MTTGVVGGAEAFAVSDALNILCPRAGVRRLDDADSVCRLNALAISGYNAAASSFTPFLYEDGMLILNADVKNICRLIDGSSATVITFGLDARACVTASSIIDGQYLTVQCCVQRKLPVISGGAVLEQEFAVNACGDAINAYSLLAAVTSALVCGAKPAEISETVVCLRR